MVAAAYCRPPLTGALLSKQQPSVCRLEMPSFILVGWLGRSTIAIMLDVIPRQSYPFVRRDVAHEKGTANAFCQPTYKVPEIG